MKSSDMPDLYISEALSRRVNVFRTKKSPTKVRLIILSAYLLI
ncbi:hypothetical protein VCRA2117O380_10378 [Vibrio crassostreae]|nr:hypothetical protein VCRA2117O379_10275 [Vibrio crassostreae]CAK1878193.1 hypothetical protein VCRA2119O381_10145 [Vibrio crassostreae]CAK1881298.1 hypothetical protein VCRA2119O382_10378 [Vibrio crassostreae]CAK1882971.1 hypothetical protein VCRA2117O380_10378 [Vibrio crassostreae]CAK2443600.1 hypothetical protein VCRA2113O360_10378 [Vibrio crassostreae]